MSNLCGIYQIKNTVTEKVYIGSSIDVYVRWRKHINELRCGSHPSPHLQASWHLYGFESFAFSVLEEISNPNCLIDREQYWLDVTKANDREHGYNTAPIAGSRHGIIQPLEIRQKISDGLKRRFATDPAFHKLTKEQVCEIKARLAKGEELEPISVDYGVSLKAISDIRIGATWEHVECPGFVPRAPQIYMRGSRAGNSKLTERQVVIIKALLMRGDSVLAIADEYGVSKTAIEGIRTNNTWLHVPWPSALPDGLPPVFRRHNHNALLTVDEVWIIKQRLVCGDRSCDIASDYGVNKGTIADIKAGRTWSYVPWPE